MEGKEEEEEEQSRSLSLSFQQIRASLLSGRHGMFAGRGEKLFVS